MSTDFWLSWKFPNPFFLNKYINRDSLNFGNLILRVRMLKFILCHSKPLSAFNFFPLSLLAKLYWKEIKSLSHASVFNLKSNFVLQGLLYIAKRTHLLGLLQIHRTKGYAMNYKLRGTEIYITSRNGMITLHRLPSWLAKQM